MKLLEWQKFFAQQRGRHQKSLFSVAELANAAQTTLHAVNTELGRLRRRGIVERYAHGVYGPAQGIQAEEVVLAVDAGAYLTGFWALFRHDLVTQVPTEVVCFTNRRLNRRADRLTPAGQLRFIHVSARIYARPVGCALAPPEQSLCDFAWLALRDGVDPRSLVTFRNLDRLNRRRLKQACQRYPENVRSAIAEIVGLSLMGRKRSNRKERKAHKEEKAEGGGLSFLGSQAELERIGLGRG